MVLSKVAREGLAAICSISSRLSAIAASSAGFKSATWKPPKGGTPPQGPVQGASNGLAALGWEVITGSRFGCEAQPSKAVSVNKIIADQRGATGIRRVSTVEGVGTFPPSLPHVCNQCASAGGLLGVEAVFQ